jgi:ABC-2 type transport system ATP-binding protein
MRVELQQIVKRYGSHVALNVSDWAAGPGEVIGLVGSNGAGKTTFLRLVLDLLNADRGQVVIDGSSVSATDDWKARTGSYLDESFLIDFLTPIEYFKFIGSVYGYRNGAAEEALRPFINLIPFIVTDDETRYIRELSLGNAKKVGIVSAMFCRPRLLILDEPFASLDPPSQIRLKQHIMRMAEADGTTMIISSHDLGHVTEICSRITLLDRGVVVRDEKTSPETLSELQLYFSS